MKSIISVATFGLHKPPEYTMESYEYGLDRDAAIKALTGRGVIAQIEKEGRSAERLSEWAQSRKSMFSRLQSTPVFPDIERRRERAIRLETREQTRLRLLGPHVTGLRHEIYSGLQSAAARYPDLIKPTSALAKTQANALRYSQRRTRASDGYREKTCGY